MFPWLLFGSLLAFLVTKKAPVVGAGTGIPDLVWAQHVLEYWKPLSPTEQYMYSQRGVLVVDLATAQWKPLLAAYLLPKAPGSPAWFFYRPAENLFYQLQ